MLKVFPFPSYYSSLFKLPLFYYCSNNNKNIKYQKIKAVRGMHDILPSDFRIQQFIIDKGRNITSKYGFKQISTPIIEDCNLFKRSIGTDSDVVSKELFTWTQSSQDVTLRPEGTSGIVRSIISPSPIKYEKIYQNIVPQKLFYVGSMFRHERPQKGRYREFTQLGVEWIGNSASNYYADIQILSMGYHFLSELGIKSTLHINTIGSDEERINYRTILQEYFNKYTSELSEYSKERLKRGSILRILDSKDICDKVVIKNAPSILDHLGNTSLDTFKRIQEGLHELDIPFIIDTKLIRGLDYYNDVIFEFCKPNTNELGESQSTILAGGRYDKLSTLLGGKEMPAVGWAAGIDRLCLIINQSLIPKSERPISVLVIKDPNDECNHSIELYALKIAHKLRLLNKTVIFEVAGSIAKQLKRANKSNSHIAVIIGISELKNNTLTIKWLDESKEDKISLDNLYNIFEIHSK